MSKLVTIGIPFYNNERTLAFAINSATKQTYTNIEILLVDDGSSDNSLKIAQKFAQDDSRIRVLSDKTNKGLIFRLNEIIDVAQGEYIARMDADDLMDLERIEKQVFFLNEHPDADVLSTGMISMTNNFEPIGKRCCTHTKPNTCQVFKNGDGILHASIMTKTIWSKKYQYLMGFERAEDRELFTRTIGKSIYYNLPEPLYFYMDVQNMTLSKYLKSYKSERKAIYKNWKGSITLNQMLRLLLRSYLKSITLGMFFATNKQESLLKSKNQPILENEQLEIKDRIIKSMS